MTERKYKTTGDVIPASTVFDGKDLDTEPNTVADQTDRTFEQPEDK